MEQKKPFSYDEVPYESQAVARTNPGAIAAIARMFGVAAVSASSARVLEIGCANGHNLLGLATAYPNAEFLGIDLSSVQIEQGKALLEKTQLKNVELRKLDILEVDSSIGKFDFIICHGIYSWVPEKVREKILEIFRTHLEPQGVAYLSYNSYPGWHVRETIREMMLFHAENYSDSISKIKGTRHFLQVFLKSLETRNVYGEEFAKELRAISQMPDWYLFHDFLSEENQPFYFSDILKDVQKAELQYLCDAEIPKLFPQELPEMHRELLKSVPGGRLRKEQYTDFFRRTMFKRSLLVQKEASLSLQLDSQPIEQLSIRSTLRPSEGPTVDLSDGTEVAFVGPNGGRVVLNDALSKAAFSALANESRRYLSFSEVLDSALLATQQNDTPETRKELSGALFRSYLAGLVSLAYIDLDSATPSNTETPLVSPLVRVEAENSALVTNPFNEPIALSNFERALVTLLDGSRNNAALLEALRENSNLPEVAKEQNTSEEGMLSAALSRLQAQGLF